MPFNTLSGRFLGLTVVFVMIAEVLIFVPSISRFRVDYLQGRLELGQLAALALLATPGEMVAPDLERELLQTAEVLNVVLRRDEIRELVLSGPVPEPVAETFDLRDPEQLALMRDALRTLAQPEDRIIRLIGLTKQGAPSEIEITLHEAPLRAAMIGYGLRILYLSLAISVSTAALLFFAVQGLIVRPINRVVAHMIAYRDDPEDARRIIVPRSGARELRQAEDALHDLQLRLTTALRQKGRLAALGGAVAKISHDLRNMLATTQLLADRLEASRDPAVKRTAPKLVSSLARAIGLCERTLAFGKAEEPPPELADFPLAPLVEEVLENEARAASSAGLDLIAEVPPDMVVRADADQLFRVLTNLVRNAVQAIEAAGAEVRMVRVSARDLAGESEILVSDTGPGLAPKARENLFQPFRGGARRGGAGLGLAIAAELVRGHGGALRLVETGPSGTVFRIAWPAP
jgi:signal transduction histidine kinase